MGSRPNRWYIARVVVATAAAVIILAVHCSAQEDTKSFASAVGPYPTVGSLHRQLSCLASALREAGLDPATVPLSLYLAANRTTMHIQLRLTCDQFRRGGPQLLRCIGTDGYPVRNDRTGDLAVAFFFKSGNYTVTPCVVVAAGCSDAAILNWWRQLVEATPVTQHYGQLEPEGFRWP